MIEQEKLYYILECARFAHSAVNYQPWHFFIVKSDNQKLLVQQAYPRERFTEAPLNIVVCADSSISWVRKSDNKNHSDSVLPRTILYQKYAVPEASGPAYGQCCTYDPACP